MGIKKKGVVEQRGWMDKYGYVCMNYDIDSFLAGFRAVLKKASKTRLKMYDFVTSMVEF